MVHPSGAGLRVWSQTLVLNSVKTAALHQDTLISFRRVLLVHKSGPSRMEKFKSRESHVEKTKEQ